MRYEPECGCKICKPDRQEKKLEQVDTPHGCFLDTLWGVGAFCLFVFLLFVLSTIGIQLY